MPYSCIGLEQICTEIEASKLHILWTLYVLFVHSLVCTVCTYWMYNNMKRKPLVWGRKGSLLLITSSPLPLLPPNGLDKHLINAVPHSLTQPRNFRHEDTDILIMSFRTGVFSSVRASKGRRHRYIFFVYLVGQIYPVIAPYNPYYRRNKNNVPL